MKIVVATAWNDLYAPLAAISVPLMKNYCERHGYDLAAWEGGYHTNELDLLTYGDRVKIHMYKQLYEKYDAFVWIDVDCLVMNSEAEVYAPPTIHWSYDPTGPVSGFFAARCTWENHLFLHTAQHRSVEMKDTANPLGRAIQDAMREVSLQPPGHIARKELVSGREAGHCYFDYGYYGWDKYKDIGHYFTGAWLCTFPAVPLAQRIELMRQWAQDAT